MAVASAHAPVPGRSRGNPAHLLNPRLKLRQEERVGHGARKLAALHRFRSLVGRFQLRIHPLVAEEARAIFRDAVPAHQADRFTHHLRAPARVPKFGSGAKDVGQRIQKNETQKRIRFQLRSMGIAGWQAEQIRRPFRRFALQLRARLGAGDSLRRQKFVRLALQRIQFIKSPRRREIQAMPRPRPSPRCPPAGEASLREPAARVHSAPIRASPSPRHGTARADTG